MTLEEISRHGNYPLSAPVNPYTELADTFKANYLPFNTAFLKGSFAALRSFLAYFLAESSSSRIYGSRPFLTEGLTK